jgi:glycerol-3-phosphate acyltransferase PlsY
MTNASIKPINNGYKTMMLTIAAAIIISYLLGSLSTAIIICKLLRLPDPRTQGSGNPGATNVLRYGGKTAAIATLAGDLLKGAIPVALAKMYGLNETGLVLTALAAFLGHLYPVFFKFKGGKGVATALGCWLVLAWPVAAALIVTWLSIAVIFRYSSLAAIIATLLAPIYAWYITNNTLAVMACIMSLLLIYRHTPNIQNLIAGKESKIGTRK